MNLHKVLGASLVISTTLLNAMNQNQHPKIHAAKGAVVENAKEARDTATHTINKAHDTITYVAHDVLHEMRNRDRDIIVEFKVGGGQPIDSTFRKIGGSGAMFGPEVTFRLYRSIYGFVNVDYLTKKGSSLDIQAPIKIDIVPIGIGLKYLGQVSRNATLYAGLGFQPTYMGIKENITVIEARTHNWAFGGVAKLGAFIDLPKNFVLDFFADFSFGGKVKFTSTQSPITSLQTSESITSTNTSHISSFNIGAGIGYRFD